MRRGFLVNAALLWILPLEEEAMAVISRFSGENPRAPSQTVSFQGAFVDFRDGILLNQVGREEFRPQSSAPRFPLWRQGSPEEEDTSQTKCLSFISFYYYYFTPSVKRPPASTKVQLSLGLRIIYLYDGMLLRQPFGRPSQI